jgi:hypothetical protein
MVNKLLMRRHAVDSRQPSRWRVAALKDDGEIVRGSAITALGRLGAGSIPGAFSVAGVARPTWLLVQDAQASSPPPRRRPTASRIQ